MTTCHLIFDVQPNRTQFQQVQILFFETLVRVVQKLPGQFLDDGQTEVFLVFSVRFNVSMESGECSVQMQSEICENEISGHVLR